jgi:hypothetical protein
MSVKRVLAALMSCVLVLAACGGDSTEPGGDDPGQDSADDVPGDGDDPDEQDSRPRSVLTGEPVDDEVVERPLMVVKIDNSPRARPQSGLDAADVVIEEVVEGGVTRFMALFHSDIPEDVGPTRSARPVDAQLVTAFGRSGFVYSGARAEVRDLLAATPAIQVTEGGAGFHRVGDRQAPHNLYNRLPQALEAVQGRDPEVLESIGWVFAEQPPAGAVTCPAAREGCTDPGAAIDVAMSDDFRTGWEYDPGDGVYRRLQNGAPFTVTGPDTIGAANVVVLATRHYLGEAECYGARCPETDATSDGDRAIVLRDGERHEATWRKPTADADLELLDEDDRPFPLKPGPTWMHMPAAADMPPPIG